MLKKNTKLKFKVWIDHKNLEYFMKTQKLNGKQLFQILYLSRSSSSKTKSRYISKDVKRRQVVDKERINIEEEKSIYIKR